ncbi:MAG TPA: DHHA1 domain-containing protein [Actinomycetota bacterium]|nr:DHHA1 domain-containing protein [Actinomycetota bacterium]
MARIKQLESELGKIRRIEQAALVEALVKKATMVDGVKLIAESVTGQEAGELRELALKARTSLDQEPAAVVFLGRSDQKALLVAALTKPLLARGVTAAGLLEPAAKALGGSAGGKPDLAMGGGPRTEAADEVLGLVRSRLEALLGRA